MGDTAQFESAGRRGKIVIAGGTGYLGRVLADYFGRQSRPVVVLSRHAHQRASAIRFVQWDGVTLGPWVRELDDADALINLAGRSVDCRYNRRNRQEIYDSRLQPTHALGQGLVVCASPPRAWLNASSATIYRHALDRPMDEATGELGAGFSVDVCEKWEKMHLDIPLQRTRKVALRTAIVLGPGSEAFAVFHRLVKLGLGGSLGGGGQFMSWIHEEDFARAVEWIIDHPKLQGPVNLAAPNPLPNREFMRDFRKAARRPIGLPAARWMLAVGAFFLRTETELILKSRRVVPGKLSASGFLFKFPRWPEAVQNILHSQAGAGTR